MRRTTTSLVALCLACVVACVERSARAEPTCAAAYEHTQLSRHNGELTAAREAAAACARPACPAVIRKDCMAWIGELDREIPTVIVVARDEASGDEGGAAVSVDGRPRPEATEGRAFALDPGTHVFRVEQPGREPAEQTVTIVRGQHDRVIRLSLRPSRSGAGGAGDRREPAPVAAGPERASEPSYVPAVVAGVGTAAAFGLSAWFGLSGRSDLSSLRQSCAPGCSDAEVDAARAKLTVSDVALGVGLVGVVATAFLLIRPPVSERPARLGRVAVELAPSPSGGAMAVSGAF